MNMTGGGLGNVFGALQRPGIPLSLYTNTAQVGGGKKTNDNQICIEMVSPSEQTLQQAKSELKREAAEEKAIKRSPQSNTPHSTKRRRTTNTSKKKAQAGGKKKAQQKRFVKNGIFSK